MIKGPTEIQKAAVADVVDRHAEDVTKEAVGNFVHDDAGKCEQGN